MATKIFLSWSGNKSRGIAEILRIFLPKFVAGCAPWISSSDIYGGSTWRDEILAEIWTSKLGIICFTSDNCLSEWLMFEAGALTASTETEAVCPFLVELSIKDLPKPLEQFQALEANKNDTWRLVKTIAKLSGDEPANFRENFEEVWPIFFREIQRVLRDFEPKVNELIQDRHPKIEAVKALKYQDVLREWNASGEGYVLCYNIEMQTFINPITFHTVWGNLFQFNNIKKVIILVPEMKSQRFLIAAESLDFLTDHNFDKFYIREYSECSDESQNGLYLDRIAFAMYRQGASPDRGILYPRAGIFSLSPPFSRLSTSPFIADSYMWTYEYTLLVDTNYEVINTLDSIWHQQSNLAKSTIHCKDLHSSRNSGKYK